MDILKNIAALLGKVPGSLRVLSKVPVKNKEFGGTGGRGQQKNLGTSSGIGKGVSELFKDEGVKRKAVIFLAWVLVVSVVSYMFVLSPISNDIDGLESKQKKLKIYSKDLAQVKGDLDIQSALMEALKRDLVLAEAIFISEDELDSFYKSVSESASDSGLKILSFEKLPPVPVYSDSIGKKRKKTELLYMKTPVKIKVTGSYAAYLKFRKDLAEMEKVVNTQSEDIALSSGKSGELVVTDVFYTYSTSKAKAKG